MLVLDSTAQYLVKYTTFAAGLKIAHMTPFRKALLKTDVVATIPSLVSIVLY